MERKIDCEYCGETVTEEVTRFTVAECCNGCQAEDDTIIGYCDGCGDKIEDVNWLSPKFEDCGYGTTEFWGVVSHHSARCVVDVKSQCCNSGVVNFAGDEIDLDNLPDMEEHDPRY